MKNNLYFIILTLIFVQRSYAQRDFAPVGAFWNYGYLSHDGSTFEQWSIKVIKDTVIQGYPAKALTKYFSGVKGSGKNFFGYLLLRSDSVFFTRSADLQTLDNTNYILNFSMKVNDTIRFLNLHPVYAVVTAMDSIIVNGVKLKRWMLDKHCGKNSVIRKATIIENIGLIDDYLLWDTDGCDMIGGGEHQFQCYNGKTIGYNQPCEQVSSSINNPGKQTVWYIYPNPAANLISIYSENRTQFKTATVKDILGKTILISSTTDVDISHLKPGIYIVKVETFNGERFIHLVKN